jgi:crossover junction endodeoxyribonuclease RuvC
MEMASLMQFKEHGIVAAVEKVGAMPGQGVTSMFNFGKSAGFIEGVLTALGIPYQLVPPNKWKKEFSLIGQDKQASIVTCRKLFPELDLKRTERCRTDSDGKAEATLLAEYARRHFGEGGME